MATVLTNEFGSWFRHAKYIAAGTVVIHEFRVAGWTEAPEVLYVMSLPFPAPLGSVQVVSRIRLMWRVVFWRSVPKCGSPAKNG